MCYTLIGLAWLHWCLWMCQSFSDMMQWDNGNIKEVLGITLLINYLAIYLIYHCIIVFCLYNEMALYNNCLSFASMFIFNLSFVLVYIGNCNRVFMICSEVVHLVRVQPSCFLLTKSTIPVQVCSECTLFVVFLWLGIPSAIQSFRG